MPKSKPGIHDEPVDPQERKRKMVWDLWPDSERIRIAMHNTAEGYREHYTQETEDEI